MDGSGREQNFKNYLKILLIDLDKKKENQQFHSNYTTAIKTLLEEEYADLFVINYKMFTGILIMCLNLRFFVLF